MAGEQVTPQAPNGTGSRLFDPARSEAPARRPAATTDDAPADPIERDPTTGRFLRPGFPGHLVAKARRLGLTDEDLADIEDPRELRDICRERDFELRLSSVFDPKRVSEALKQQQNIETPTARPPLDLGLNDEEDNPRLVEALVKLRDHYEGQIDDLRKQVTELGGKQAQREARETQNVDRTFEKAFAIFPSVFGEGLGKNVSATKMNIRRAAAAFWHENGGDEDSVVRLVKRFVSEEFGGKRKPAPQRTAYVEDDDDDEDDDDEEVDEETQWERGVLHRPTQAGSREAPPGRDKAVQGIKRRMAPVQQARDSRQPRGIYLNSGRRSTER